MIISTTVNQAFPIIVDVKKQTDFSPLLDSVEVRGATRNQICSFFEHRSKGGGGHFHVQKFWSKFCMILKAFWQHKIDIKRLYKGRNVKILRWICHNFHRLTHYFVKLCRDRRFLNNVKKTADIWKTRASQPHNPSILSIDSLANIN